MDLLSLALTKRSSGNGQGGGQRDVFIVNGTPAAGENDSIRIEIDKTIPEIHQSVQNGNHVELHIDGESTVIIPLLTVNKEGDYYYASFQTILTEDETPVFAIITFSNSTTGDVTVEPISLKNDTKPLSVNVEMSANEQLKLVMRTDIKAEDLFEQIENGRYIIINLPLGEGVTSTNILPVASYKIETDGEDTIYYFECKCEKQYYSMDNKANDYVVFTEE